MFKGTFFKIKSSHGNLRTEKIEGVTQELPVVGNCFYLQGKGLEFGARFVHTTPIYFCTQLEDTFLFKTVNSTYVFDVLNDVGENNVD